MPTGCVTIRTGTRTVSTAPALVTELTALRTTTSYTPPLFSCASNTNDAPVPPATATPSLRHWYSSPVPLAATVKRAFPLRSTLLFSGCPVISTCRRTLNATASLVTECNTRRVNASCTFTRSANRAPSSAADTEANCSVAATAPGTALPSRSHWYCRAPPTTAGSPPRARASRVSFSPGFNTPARRGCSVISARCNTRSIAVLDTLLKLFCAVTV